MFGFLKKKIGQFFSKEEGRLDKKIEEKVEAAPAIESVEEAQVVQQVRALPQETPEPAPTEKKKKEPKKEEIKEEPVSEPEEVPVVEQPATEETIAEPVTEEPVEAPVSIVEAPKEEKRRFLPKLTFGTKIKKAIIRKAEIKEADVADLLWDFQMALLESDVAVPVADELTNSIKRRLVGKEINSRESVHDLTQRAIRESLLEVLDQPQFDLLKKVREKKPSVIMFVGPNGHGKTTTIAKLAHLLQKNGLSCVLAAADTFRAASIEQLEAWGQRVNVNVIKHNYGADPAAVCFDAISHARSKGIDVVLIDTAGRSELNTNLMEQLKKVVKVAKPDVKIYIGEALAGNAAVEEATKFNNLIGIDGVIITKVDCDVKGGGLLSISYSTKRPVLYVGLGQGLDDLQQFTKEWMVQKLLE